MKAITIFALLSLFVLNTVEARVLALNSHYVCDAFYNAEGQEVSGSAGFEIYEELVPMGEMLPAFKHVWSMLVVNNGTDNDVIELDFMSSENPDAHIFGSEGFEVFVGPASAKITDPSGNVAKCVASSFRPMGICTKDMNQHGNPSVCECGPSHTYSSVSGTCELF